MSKSEDEIISVMSESEWLTLSQIIELVPFKKATTKTTVCRLVNQELVLRKETPAGTALYKKALKSCGFGISRNMADFDSLLRTVRPL